MRGCGSKRGFFMKSRFSMNSRFIISGLAASLILGGCSIDHHRSKNEEGSDKDKNVEIKTPLGGLKVTTDDVDAKDTGLAVYPGARIKPSDDKDGDKKANVNINTPWFGLKVVALEYESDDAQDKIWDFYKKELSKYGKVLECKPGSPDMNIEKKEKDDLTCKDSNVRINGKESKAITIEKDEWQLKVGSANKQRVVGLKQKNGKTNFALVYVNTRGERDTI
jgi:hypothetical protein